MLDTSAWEAVFLLVVLKIPMVYLAVVVWWAIRAEPSPEGGQDEVRTLVPLTPCGWDDWRRRRVSRLPGRRPFQPTGRPSGRVPAPATLSASRRAQRTAERTA